MTHLTKFLVSLLLFTIATVYSQGGASSCAQLEANFQPYQSCATNIPFQNSTGGNSENFATTCIRAPFNGPTWFFMEIQTTGNILLQISQTNTAGTGTDVDFVLWGPFANLNNICSKLDRTTEVDCSWLPDSVETVNLPNAVAGQLYVLLVDNYSNQPGNITITQTGGTGSSNCDFLSSVKILDNTLNEITQFDYCNPASKDIVAKIDVSDFPGLLTNLRFNYKWYKNNILINTITNSTSNTNTFSATDSGVYKVETTAYDSTDPTVIIANLRVSSDDIDLKFHTTPTITISNTNTECLNTNPVLQSSITNQPSLNAAIDIITYQWYLNSNAIPDAVNQNHTPIVPGDYFVRSSNSPCSTTDSNSIHIRENPSIPHSEEPNVICIDKNNIVRNPSTINTMLSDTDYDFVWYNGSDTISGNEIIGENSSTFQTSVAGLFSVKFTNTTNSALCSGTANFSTVNSYIPFSIQADPAELIALEIENMITAIVSPPSSDYVYSLDNNGWQTSNIFTNILRGEHTLTVRNKYNCGEISTQIMVVEYPKFFTPNGDGYHDTWNFAGLSALDAVQIHIFDRFGKLIKEISPNGTGWDGTFNRTALPSSDYWFKLTYKKNQVEKEFNGHFALKR